jgi:hypothetical protein
MEPHIHRDGHERSPRRRRGLRSGIQGLHGPHHEGLLMFKIGVASGRGFLGALLSLAGGFRELGHMIGPSAPIAGSSFRKRSRQRGRKYISKHPPNTTGWYQRNAEINPMPITLRMLERHSWYRRQMRKHGIKIEPGAKNAMVLR